MPHQHTEGHFSATKWYRNQTHKWTNWHSATWLSAHNHSLHTTGWI